MRTKLLRALDIFLWFFMSFATIFSVTQVQNDKNYLIVAMFGTFFFGFSIATKH